MEGAWLRTHWSMLKSQILSDSIAEFGGRFLVRGGAMEVLEGDWKPKRLVVLEFPDLAALKAWYHSPGYQQLLALRKQAAISNFVIVEGV